MNKKQTAKRVLLSAAWAVSVFVLWPRVKQVNATVTHEFSDLSESSNPNRLYSLLTDEDLEEDAIDLIITASNSVYEQPDFNIEYPPVLRLLEESRARAVLAALRKLAEPDD